MNRVGSLQVPLRTNRGYTSIYTPVANKTLSALTTSMRVVDESLGRAVEV